MMSTFATNKPPAPLRATASSDDESALVCAIIQRRDRAAFETLFTRYQDRAYSLARHLLRNPALAEEAVQEAFLQLWSTPRLALNGRSVCEWILGIVAGKSMNIRRKHQRSSRREQALSILRAAAPVGIGEQSESGELSAALQARLEALPEDDSHLLACAFGARLTHQKIAELLGIPRRTVSQKIQQALQRLKSSLQHAGVAAAIPLLADTGLHPALTGGHACPAHVLSAVTNSLGNGALSARSVSRLRRPSCPASGHTAWLAAAVSVCSRSPARSLTAPVPIRRRP